MNNTENLTIATIAKKDVIAAGSEFLNTLPKNFPFFCFFWFSSNVNKNAGIPIVNALPSDTWFGSSGYCIAKIIEYIDNNNENIFLYVNNEADFVILLIFFLPSYTISLIFPKSESSNTTCAVSLAASAPEPIAIEQSDSFIAKISFTPSPVIATFNPNSFKALIISFFCSGFTLPKIVYFFTALLISS